MTRRKSHKPVIGSVSSGTLRTKDLLVAFADELEWIAPRGHAKLIRDARSAEELLNSRENTDCYDESVADETYEIVDELQNALNEHAPDYLYFGAHEGDGADFGWWPMMDAIEELDTFDDTDEARKAGFHGDFKVVSDHGNVEVYRRMRNGHVKSVIGIV